MGQSRCESLDQGLGVRCDETLLPLVYRHLEFGDEMLLALKQQDWRLPCSDLLLIDPDVHRREHRLVAGAGHRVCIRRSVSNVIQLMSASSATVLSALCTL